MRLAKDVIDGIYAAALDAQRWPDALRGIGRTIGAQADAMLLTDTRLISRNLTLTTGLLDQQSVRDDYRNYFGAIDPAVALFAGLPVGQATTTSMAWAPQVVARDEFYNDFYARLTLRDSLGAPLLREQGCAAFLAMHRDKHAGLFSTQEVALFTRYLPHLRLGLKLHRQIVHQRRRAETFEQLFERLHLGVALLHGSGAVVYLNRAARMVLARADGLVERNGMLAAQHRVARVTLARLIAATARGHAPLETTLALPRDQSDEHYMVLVGPYRPAPDRHDDLALAQSPLRQDGLVLLLIRDPQDMRGDTMLMLRRQYRLTGAEARLLEDMAFGQTLRQHCDRRAITINTGRFHLRALYAKTGVRRQSDLVRLASRIVNDLAALPDSST